MKKVDWLTQTQIKSLVDGGSMFFEILEEKYKTIIPDNASSVSKLLFCEKIAKLYLGDEFYVQEEFTELNSNQYGYKYSVPKKDWDWFDWQPKEKMQPHQSRVKAKIKNVELVRCQDLSIEQVEKISCMSSKVYSKENNGRAFKLDTIDYFNKICQEQNLNIRYEDNPYIILDEIEKELKCKN